MKKNLFSLIILCVLFAGCALTHERPEQNALYQISTINALLEGAYDGNSTLQELGQHGNFGIGTYESLDGEMVVSDGRFFQIRSDGHVYEPAQVVKSPFATVTYFKTDNSFKIPEGTTLENLKELIGSRINPNLPYAIRVKGNFPFVKTRSVPSQTKPYPKLVEVTKNQPTFDIANTSGELIGFYVPGYLNGINVAGFHLHYLSSDHQTGGHLLAFTANNATVELAAITDIHLVLPTASETSKLDLSSDKTKEIESAEK